MILLTLITPNPINPNNLITLITVTRLVSTMPSAKSIPLLLRITPIFLVIPLGIKEAGIDVRLTDIGKIQK